MVLNGGATSVADRETGSAGGANPLIAEYYAVRNGEKFLDVIRNVTNNSCDYNRKVPFNWRDKGFRESG
jgi:hypothetical protein